MPGVSEQQVKMAREVDHLSYLQANEPQELLQPNRYTARSQSGTKVTGSTGRDELQTVVQRRVAVQCGNNGQQSQII